MRFPDSSFPNQLHTITVQQWSSIRKDQLVFLCNGRFFFNLRHNTSLVLQTKLSSHLEEKLNVDTESIKNKRDWKNDPFTFTEKSRLKAVRPPKPLKKKKKNFTYGPGIPLSILTYKAALQMCLAQKVILKTKG